MTVIGDASVVNCRVAEFVAGTTSYLAARFDVNVLTAGAIDLSALMDAIVGKVPSSATARTYAWPAESIEPPCAIVAYPEEPIEFDLTMGRGTDGVTFPLFFVVPNVVGRAARDSLSEIITGASGIKDAIDGDLTTA